MSGTLTQLAAKGAQDKNLTVQPEITFFKGNWKHHTNFAIEAIEQEFTTGEAKSGTTATAEIPRSGDLVSDIWVKIQVAPVLNPNGFPFNPLTDPYFVTYVDEVGHALIKKVKIEIGGHQFDAHNSEYLHVYHELTKKAGRDTDRLIGKFDNFVDRVKASSETQHLYVPLRFWFNETTSQALPLVALMYHQVKVVVEFRTSAEVLAASPTQKNLAMGDQQANTTEKAGEDWPLAHDVQEVGFSTLAPITATNAAVAGQPLVPQLKNYRSATTVNSWDLTAGNGVNYTGTGVAGYTLGSSNGDVIQSCKLLINYVFLDSVERKLFATMEHNYLIDTVQVDKPSWSTNDANSLSIMLNHPVKELIWCVRASDCVTDTPTGIGAELSGGRLQQRWGQMWKNGSYNGVNFNAANNDGYMKNYFNFTGPSPCNTELHGFDTATLKLNGHTRFEDVRAPFLHTVQPSQYHSSTPKSMIYNYSFALDPEDWKPTGSINMSRIDTVKLDLKHFSKTGLTVQTGNRPNGEVFIFARSINIMKITSGMAGLKYSN